MPDITQIAKWKQDYINGLRRIIDDIPYEWCRMIMGAEGGQYDPTKAKECINTAAKKGLLCEGDEKYLINAFVLLCGYFTSGEEKQYSSMQEALDSVDGDLNSEDFFCQYAYFCLYSPVFRAFAYIIKNNPLRISAVWKKQLTPEDSWRIKAFKASLPELFSFITSMTTYGVYQLLVNLNCNAFYQDKIFNAIQNGDYDSFERFSMAANLDLTELAEIAGYIQHEYCDVAMKLENADALNDNEENEDNGLLDDENAYSEVFAEAGVSNDDSIFALGDYDIGYYIPEIQDPEYAIPVWTTCWHSCLLYHHLSNSDYYEAREINRILGNPDFNGILHLTQAMYYFQSHRLPENTPVLLTDEELSSFRDGENCTQLHDEVRDASFEKKGVYSLVIKTLASRWMTEPYHRMTDNTLVELFSQKIWPQLSTEVDGLQWTPAKRALPTFEKTKNMLAACILFHALELAKIAKLPKQEDDEVSDVEYMSAEDRAQSGISATSNRNAGIVHTKKKYNDTLPVGYMEVLEKFIPEEALPGRTTSRTYLKLVNRWVKMKLESVRDNIDSEASAKLFIAECKSDLGPQFYLYQDNRVKMKALLKEWKDKLPEIFNVPI